MATYDLRGLGQDFVVHYGGDDTRIDAFTFANSLTALATALQAANKEVNPGFSLEVSVVALGGGSFRPSIRARAKRISGLLLGDVRSGIVGAVVALMITRMMGDEPKTVVNIENVEIHSGDGDVIILPHDVYKAYERAKKSQEVNRAIRQTFETIEEDDQVKSFGFARDRDEKDGMPFQVDRSRFGEIARPKEPIATGQREQIERAQVQIVRAIFEDSTRRWQFVWRGIKISAPVLDIDFRKRIVAGAESFRHGDVLDVDLRIVQSLEDSGIWVNELYEVLKVYGHQSATPQGRLLD